MPNWKHYNVNEPLINFEIKEKLDGANLRFKFNKDGTMTFGTRNVFPVNGDAEAGDFSKGENKKIKPFLKYVEGQTLGHTITEEYFHLVFFAEAMIKHSIPYKVPKSHMVVGFDVYDLEQQIWRKDWKQLFWTVGMPTVNTFPQNGRTPISVVNLIEELDEKEQLWSALDNKAILEGIVMVDYDLQHFYKYKTARYLALSGTKEKVPKVASIETFYLKYFTNDRIEEWILKMEVEGRYNKKNPVATLLAYVVKDVFEEASSRDLVKAFGDDVRRMLMENILLDGELMRKAIALKD